MLAGEVTRGLLESVTQFAPQWLAAGEKKIVPLPVSTNDVSPLTTYTVACRLAGHVEVLALPADPDRACEEVLVLPAENLSADWAENVPAPCLLTTLDRSSALLATGSGYGLLAGASGFLALVLPGGIEEALVDFGRYARRASRHQSALASVAAKFPGRKITRRTRVDLDPAVGAGRQVRLMVEFAAGEIEGAAFSAEWMSARRESLDSGERLGDQMSVALDGVFYALEQYAYDPAFAEPGDISTEELRDAIGETILVIDRL